MGVAVPNGSVAYTPEEAVEVAKGLKEGSTSLKLKFTLVAVVKLAVLRLQNL